MSEFSNPPSDCLVCGEEYDVLDMVDESSRIQTQGKANVCIKNMHNDETAVFYHFEEKYL